MRYNRSQDWLAAATAYARSGWPVVPMHGIRNGRCTCADTACTTPGNHAWAEFWESEATLSRDDLQAYSGLTAAYHLGVALGPQSGLAALVAEDHNAFEYVRYHHPPVALFGNGPCFRCDERGTVWLLERPESLGDLPDEVELDDGLTLLLGTHLLRMPPHLHAAARGHDPFAWLSRPPKQVTALPPAPWWVLADAGLITPEEFARVSALEQAHADALEENRHQSIHAHGEALQRRRALARRDRSAPRTAAVAPPAQPADPAPEPAVERADAPPDVRVAADPTPPTEPTAAGASAPDAAPTPRSAAPPPPSAAPAADVAFPPLTFATGESWDDTPAPPVAGPWVRQSTTTLLLGDPKRSGTTTFLLHLAQAVLGRRSFLGHPARRSPVLYLTTQTRASFRVSRHQSVMRQGPIFDALCTLYLDEVGAHSWRSMMRGAVRQAVDIGARLLIIDGLDRFAAIDGALPDAAAVLDELNDAAREGIAVVASMPRAAGPAQSAFADDLARGVDQQLSLVRGRSRGSTSRELHASSRFSGTPPVTHLDYVLHTRKYRVVSPPGEAHLELVTTTVGGHGDGASPRRLDLRLSPDALGTSGDGLGTSGDGLGTSGDGLGTSGDGLGTSGDGLGTSGDGLGTSGDGRAREPRKMAVGDGIAAPFPIQHLFPTPPPLSVTEAALAPALRAASGDDATSQFVIRPVVTTDPEGSRRSVTS